MRRSVHQRGKGRSTPEWVIHRGRVTHRLRRKHDTGLRECTLCEALIAPCADCGEAWQGPCPHCLAGPECMSPVML